MFQRSYIQSLDRMIGTTIKVFYPYTYVQIARSREYREELFTSWINKLYVAALVFGPLIGFGFELRSLNKEHQNQLKIERKIEQTPNLKSNNLPILTN